MVDDGDGTAIEILDGNFGVVDAEVMIDGRKKIAGAMPVGDGVLAKLVGGADDLAPLNAAARPDV